MFAKHHTLMLVAIAAVVAAVAVPSALASGDRTREACQGDAIYVTITDDLGLSQLVPVAHGNCTTNALATCTAAAQTGWVSVNDDLGVPFLVPTGDTQAAAPGLCVLAQASSPAPASKIAKVQTKKSKITKSKYQGWVWVTDTTNSAKLVSRSDLRG